MRKSDLLKIPHVGQTQLRELLRSVRAFLSGVAPYNPEAKGVERRRAKIFESKEGQPNKAKPLHDISQAWTPKVHNLRDYSYRNGEFRL